MAALLMQQAPSAATVYLHSEGRAEPRSRCPRLARIRPQTGSNTRERLSLVQNVSSSGIGLFLTQSLERGTLVEVELRSRLIIKRVAQVVHATRQEGGWLVGCKLDHPLSASELEAVRS